MHEHPTSPEVPKYQTTFENKNGKFSICSMENYHPLADDIKIFTQILDDEPVRNYITDDAMTRWGHSTVESLSNEILTTSAERWKENKERRFLIRGSDNSPIGMIGVTLENATRGELWYYKTSVAPSLMYEALQAAIIFLKQEGIEELFATYEQNNVRSRDILEKLSFQPSSSRIMNLYL